MREAILAAIAAILFVVSVPVAIGTGYVPPTEETAEEAAAPPVEEPATAAIQETSQSAAGFDVQFSLPVDDDGTVSSISLHDYLVGALLGEMPTSFAPEALKAQVVACRTYALRQYKTRKHSPAAVCLSSACCESWVSPDSDTSLEGQAARALAEQAVYATDGVVATYEGQLIDATFFSCSGGRTEAASAVWGKDVPYLQAVDSPGEEAAPRFAGEVSLSAQEFQETILSANEKAVLEGSPETWVGESASTAGGGVATIMIGGQSFTGVELRRLFGLNSTAFTLTLQDGQFVFSTKGFGHRVGMSQYGANAMALAGADYQEILAFYYQGTETKELLPFASEQLVYALQ